MINPLRRDPEVVTGEREGEEGSGVLVELDQAQFTEELYQSRGGQVGKVPSVAASAIETLRAAIPALVSGDSIETAQKSQGAEAAPNNTEAAQSAQGDAPAAAEPESTRGRPGRRVASCERCGYAGGPARGGWRCPG